MNTLKKAYCKYGASLWSAMLLCLTGTVSAQPSVGEYTSVPPLISESSTPNVMLLLSKDHELYKKAYPDYSDLDGDGVLDTSYKDTFTYSGYFDSNFCYRYEDTGNRRFIPVTNITGQTTNGEFSHRCNAVAGSWSGNFLNWASMTRMDIVRSVLYGGYRSTDTATTDANSPGQTVLERVYVPEDAHAFVKVFSGDTGLYTPHNTTTTGGAISLCSVSGWSGLGSTYNGNPLLRVGYGAWPVWSATERRACHYDDEDSQNRNSSSQPYSNDSPGTASLRNLIVRVEVCKDGADTGSDRCKAYTDLGTGLVTDKPVGLLQRYGDDGSINFGLMTASYENKISGGVLRKNITRLTGNEAAEEQYDEINLANGRFINQEARDEGIINTLNRLRIINWDYADNYSDCNETSTYKITVDEFRAAANEQHRCRNWGNPLAEIYLEAVRYFTGSDMPGGTPAPTGTFSRYSGTNTPINEPLGLPVATWNEPINSSNYCGTCSIVVLSTGLNTFDSDDIHSVSDIWGDTGNSRLTPTWLHSIVDDIGDFENITGGSYLMGRNGDEVDNEVDDLDICSAKTVTETGGLSSVLGLCPELPNMQGSMHIAGLAYHAQTTDLRNDFDGIQNVASYSVALAENLPSFSFDVNGKAVSFVPTCQATSIANGDDHTSKLDMNDGDRWVNCSFLDVVVEHQDEYGGSLYVIWEDALAGQDFDMDGISRIEYCIGDDTSLCPGQNVPAGVSLGDGYNWSDFTWRTNVTENSVQFRVSAIESAGGKALRFGYTLSGVTDGGGCLLTNTLASAMQNDNGTCDITSHGEYQVKDSVGNGDHSLLLLRGGANLTFLSSGSGRAVYHEPAVYTGSDSVSVGKTLENPLWFAAKYGRFNDLNNDGRPGPAVEEWDARDNISGVRVPDGLPDNFFPVRDPGNLVTSLSEIFEVIAERISSGTAAAVVANSSTGLGAVYQAYYHPVYSDDEGNNTSWGGVLHSLFIDASGRFREDYNQNGALDGAIDPNGSTDVTCQPGVDYVIDIYYDQSISPSRTRFQRYRQIGEDNETATLQPCDAPQDLQNLQSIWNARNELANISDVTTQRSVSGGEFGSTAQSGRYIFTYLDSPDSGTEGVVDSGEVVDFVASNFESDSTDPDSSSNFRYLGLQDTSESEDLVNYIRGDDESVPLTWRNRTVELPGIENQGAKTWRLGDILHSSPLVVNPPEERYDFQYNDETYANFKQQYANRRQMVYVGANDGMLHAFNAGFWDAPNKTFHTRGNDGNGTFNQGLAHNLGAEMWAYVPMNLLPHLQWLKSDNYPHVYYMDGPPQAFDVNIFTPDATHPHGWGTILVAGMRLGGGPFPVDLDGDGLNDRTMRSSYVIMDITDPEGPPTLLAEVTAPDMGLTSSVPTLVKARQPDGSGNFANPQVNRWMLVFGSGPDSIERATSSRGSKFYAYDLVNRQMVDIADSVQPAEANPPDPADTINGYFGDLLAVDWNRNYIDDVVYVGTVEGTEFAPEGRLKRLVLSNTDDTMGLAAGIAQSSDVVDVNQPIVSRPISRRDQVRRERWLNFGTGRLYTRDDNSSMTQQSVYGVKESTTYDNTIAVNSLFDSTDILVTTDGAVYDGAVGEGNELDVITDADGNGSTFPNLVGYMTGQPGWVRDMNRHGAGAPSERVFVNSLLNATTMVYSSYLPSENLCSVEGEGCLNAVNFGTGTAEPFAPFGSDEVDGSTDRVARTSAKQCVVGAFSAPVLIVSHDNAPGADDDDKIDTDGDGIPDTEECEGAECGDDNDPPCEGDECTPEPDCPEGFICTPDPNCPGGEGCSTDPDCPEGYMCTPDPDEDENSDECTQAIAAGTSAGALYLQCFDGPPGSGGRLSWELMDIPF